MKIIKKAYRVWVHSHIGEYPVFRIEDLEVVYADTESKAKYQCELYDSKNEYDEPAKWIDIKCKRAKEYDKIEYNGETMERWQYTHRLEQEQRNLRLSKLDEKDSYYVQDSRNYVGNSVVFWAKDGNGYTTNINNAHKYTKEEVLKDFHNGRETDIVWSAKHIEQNIKQHVDTQGLNRAYSV